MKWRPVRLGTWFCGAFTVRHEREPRTQTDIYELWDATRFVDAFRTPEDARQCAENMQDESVQRRRVAG